MSARVRIQSTKGERMKRVRLIDLTMTKSRPLVLDPTNTGPYPKYIAGEPSYTVEAVFADVETAMYLLRRRQQPVHVRVDLRGEHLRGVMHVKNLQWEPRGRAEVVLVGGRDMKLTYTAPTA